MSVQRFDLATIAASPWKNGGGATREIACWPPGAGLDDFDWRISVATLAASGPFSVFPGVDRVITLLSGEGVWLRGAGIAHRLDEPLAPWAFSGDQPIEAQLNGGTSQDFNVMTRRQRCQARVEVLRGAVSRPAAAGSAHLVLVADGQWQLGLPDGVAKLTEGQGLWWEPAALSSELALQPTGAALDVAALWVTIFYKNDAVAQVNSVHSATE